MHSFTDKELGKIVIKPHPRAVRIIARRKPGYIQLTVPYGLSPSAVLSSLEQMRPKLTQTERPLPVTFSETDVFRTFSFDAQIVTTPMVEKMSLSLKNGKLAVFVPSGLNILLPHHQAALREALINVLRLEAKRVLPQKTAFFARKFNLAFENVSINTSKTRWGSCSSKKNINYSLFLMLLPEKYINYVVLHELTHTEEMNHGERFWKLLDGFCGENARALAKEARKFTSREYRFLTQE